VRPEVSARADDLAEVAGRPNLGVESHYGNGLGVSPHPRRCFGDVLRMTGREMIPWQGMKEVPHEVCLSGM
jgi:hypothetical protein